MRFPRHMYKDMVLLSTVVLGPFKNELIRWMLMKNGSWQKSAILYTLMTRQLEINATFPKNAMQNCFQCFRVTRTFETNFLFITNQSDKLCPWYLSLGQNTGLLVFQDEGRFCKNLAPLVGTFYQRLGSKIFWFNFTFESLLRQSSLLLHVMIGDIVILTTWSWLNWNIKKWLRSSEVLIHGSIAIAEQREIVDLTCP